MTGPSPSSDRRPDRFGAYKVLELLGTGGMGRVYRALDEALQREVALKTLLPALAADSDFVTRFTREARSAAALNHPNITQIYTTGQEGEIPYFAMELIRGLSLETLARDKGALDPAVAAHYMIQAASGLRHAAQKGLIHRDVKPSNLMLTEDGVVKITDFGLAKAARADTRLTATGEVLGSPGYISPEQAQGQDIDLRSDIYSLGATFYHLVTGRLPFVAPTAVAMIMKHMNEPVRSPRTLNADIPYPIAAIIQKMMAKRPAERFQDYDTLIHDLERAISETQPLGARPATADNVTIRRRAAPRMAEQNAPAEEVPAPSSLPWLPAGLMIALLGLVGAGIWRQMGGGEEEASATQSSQETAALPSIEGEGSFTSHPATQPGAPPAGGRDRAAASMMNPARANLIFLNSDHDAPPAGGLRLTGRVQNAGGLPAHNGRVRIRLLLDNGTVAAQGETALKPSVIPPGQSATYEMQIDYAGPLGTIKAELIWTD